MADLYFSPSALTGYKCRKNRNEQKRAHRPAGPVEPRHLNPRQAHVGPVEVPRHPVHREALGKVEAELDEELEAGAVDEGPRDGLLADVRPVDGLVAAVKVEGAGLLDALREEGGGGGDEKCKPELGAHFRYFLIFSIMKMIFGIFYQVNLTGSGLLKKYCCRNRLLT